MRVFRTAAETSSARRAVQWRKTDCDVLVIGGGISGAATAWGLASFGADVLLVDKTELNMAASGRNAGSLHGQIQYPSYIERGHQWGQRFRSALRFVADSLTLWAELSGQLGVDLEVSTNGGLLVCDNKQQMRVVEAKVALEQGLGIESRVIDRTELLEMAPYMSSSMVGAEYCPIEGKANPLLAVPALASKAKAAGVRIETGVSIVDVDLSQDRVVSVSSDSRVITSRVVVCVAGSGLISLSRKIGRSLPLIEEPVQVSATESADQFVDHLVYFAGAKLTLKQAKSGNLLIGGGWPARVGHGSRRLKVDPEALRRNLAVACRVVPRIGSLSLIRSWPGFGIATPDLSPIIGRLGDERLLVGIYPHMGFTAGPLMGKVLSRLALGRDPGIDLSPFSPMRF